MSEQAPNFGNKLHAGHIAILLGIAFWILFVLQPYIDPTPENLPTQSLENKDDKNVLQK